MNWSEAKILFKFTSRSRPDKFERGLSSIVERCKNLSNSLVLVSVDIDDPTLPKYTEIAAQYARNKKVPINIICSYSEGKIHAINRDVDTLKFDWDILVCWSDDMVIIKDGFDDSIREKFAKYFPDGDGALHLADQHQGANCMTLSVFDRKYFERDNYIYHPKFKSLWCDVVAQEVAQLRERYAYDPEVMFHHLHPSFGDTPYDKQYQLTESMEVRQYDYKVYLDLKKEYDPETKFPIRPI